jgi:gas vesicle protein
MRFGRRNTPKDWARLAMKLGLIVTDARTWATVQDEIKERANDIGGAVKQKYAETADQLAAARAELERNSDWFARTTSLLAGVGVGIAVAMLFAPASGEETRANLRDKAMEAKSSVEGLAARATRGRASVTGMSTGTQGD